LRATFPRLEGILAGWDELVLRALPQRVLEDFKRTDSESACRYWEVSRARFSPALDFGSRPDAGGESPPCDRH
jgi:hypothetical protein